MQKKIGKVVIEAYIKKDKANQIEDEAIKLLERRLIAIPSFPARITGIDFSCISKL